jgi:hypothetical protein
VNCAVFSSCFCEGPGKRLSAFVRFRPDLLRTFDEELFRVYGEHHLHVAARVVSLHDAHSPVYAYGLYRHPEEGGPFAYLHGNIYHLSSPSRRGVLRTSARPPDVARWDTVARRTPSGSGPGKAAFGVLRGERSRRRIPSSSMAYRRRGRQQVNECCSVYVPTTISQTSMLRIRRVAIGLFDYSQPVMVARTIALLDARLASAVRGGVPQIGGNPCDFGKGLGCGTLCVRKRMNEALS